MAQQGTRPVKLGKVDPVWTRVRDEAEDAARREPALTGFIYATVLNHDTLESAIVHRISERLSHADVGAIRSNVDELQQQLNDSGLFGGEQLVPERIETL